MSRVAAPLKCKEDEIISLNEMINNSIYTDDMKRRANIILLANDGLSNKQIAAEINSNENTVAMWRNRFLKDRLAGLRDLERPGRRGSKGINKRIEVIEAAQQNGDTSVQKLAEETDTSVDTVRRALNDAGISVGSKRTYEIKAGSELNKVCAEIKGLYVSGTALAMVLRIDNTLAQTLDEGAVSSRNRDLAEEAGVNTTLAELLDLMSEKKKETAVKEVGLGEFLKKTDDSLRGDIRHIAFIFSGRYKLPKGFVLKNMNMITMQDERSWHACVSNFLNLLSSGNEGKKIYNSLVRYIQSRTDGEESFVWTRKPLDFDLTVRQEVINSSDISYTFTDQSVNNVAWVKYGYATRDGEYAEFTETKENVFPERDETINGDPLKIAGYAGEVVNGVRSLFSSPQKKMAEEYMNGSGKKNGSAK